MSSLLRYPALLLEGHAGGHLALTVERDPAAALGDSPREALRQLRETLASEAREEPGTDTLLSFLRLDLDVFPAPRRPLELLDPQLLEVAVPIHPEYTSGERVYASERTIVVRAAVVWGATRDGLLRAVLPLHGLEFSLSDPAGLGDLARHYLQTQLKGSTPQRLARLLPPRSVQLTEVRVRAPERRAARGDAARAAALLGVAEPIVELAAHAPSRAFERNREVAGLRAALAGGRASLLLLGERGCGKTTILFDAVRGLPVAEAGAGPGGLTRDGCYLTSGGRLIAGMKYLGQWQERCEAVIRELSAIDGLLAIEDLLSVVRLGGHDATDSVAAFLTPYLQSGELRLLAEATPSELDACRRLLPSFADAFEVLRVPPFDDAAALAVLDRLAESYGLRVVEPSEAPEAGIERGTTDLVDRLFRRFLPYDAFPGKATAFLTELRDEARRERAAVTRERATRLFIRRTGLPEVLLSDDLPLTTGAVRQALETDVLGQPEACDAVARAVTAFKASLHDPLRPLAVLLFAGPTGVGKTALARSLARFCFGQGEKGDRLVRLDMSEYGGPGAVHRLLGDVGCGDGAGGAPDWIRRVREQPFCVLLLDEVEKAAPAVFDVLLGLLDEGRLTDRFGALTSFRSAFVVLTTNLGATSKAPPGFGDAPPPAFEREAMDFFRPELFNRLDRVVAFAPLAHATVREIARKELLEVARREGFVEARLRLVFTDAVVDHLADVGFDPLFGARPLQRAIEAEVVAPLARILAARRELAGAEVRVDVEEGAVRVSVA